MRRILLLAVLILAFSVPARADRVCVGRVPWSKANVAALHGADLAAVAKFVNATRPATFLTNQIMPDQVAGFAWAKVGGGKSDLVVAIDYAGRGFYRLWVYSHGSADSLAIQELEGWKPTGGLKGMLGDLNGDGVDELIIPTAVGQGGVWTPTTAAPLWPAVYRPQNGKYVEPICGFPGLRSGSVQLSTRYVEASRDFPNFYDTKVLPNLDRTISMLQRKAAEDDGNPDALAHFIVERDKILRVLGRDPVAGLNHAYRWMNSDDPQVLQCAIATLYDIGGHEKELREARQRKPGVIKRAIECTKGELQSCDPESTGGTPLSNGAGPAGDTIVRHELPPGNGVAIHPSIQ